MWWLSWEKRAWIWNGSQMSAPSAFSILKFSWNCPREGVHSSLFPKLGMLWGSLLGILPWPLSLCRVCWKVWAALRGSRIHQPLSDAALSFHLEQPSASGLHSWPAAGGTAQLHSAGRAGLWRPQRGESHETITAWTAVGSCVSANTSQVPGKYWKRFYCCCTCGISALSKLFLWGAIAVKAGCQHITCHCSAETL